MRNDGVCPVDSSLVERWTGVVLIRGLPSGLYDQYIYTEMEGCGVETYGVSLFGRWSSVIFVELELERPD